MVERYHYYNIFSPEGKLLQVEYALEAINNSTPVVIARNSDIIVCASKKLYNSKLLDEVQTSFYKISPKIYAMVTGLPGDVDQVILKAKNMCFSKEHNLGIELSADILCRAIADKAQKLIQGTGERPYAFGLSLFGYFNNNPIIYSTDTSAICYPYFGTAMGEKSGKMNKFLEKNLKRDISDDELMLTVCQTLMESIGEDASFNEIEVGVMDKSMNFRILNSSETDLLLQRISDK